MLPGDMADAQAVLATARRWFGDTAVVASRMGAGGGGGGHAADGHSCAVTDFALRDDGFERLLVVAAAGTSDSRAGRIAQRLLEIETYRLMALRGLPVAKALAPMLAAAEADLAGITARLDATQVSEQQLLHELIALAATVERATAEHMYRFSATQAYDTLVRQRITELRELAIPGAQTIGEFMQRRLSPAMATVAANAQRLASLSQRIERAGALLRTRVDIATEAQNQQLLAKLTRGQEAAVAPAGHGGRPVDCRHLVLRRQPASVCRQGGQGVGPAGRPGNRRRGLDSAGAVGGVERDAAHPSTAARWWLGCASQTCLLACSRAEAVVADG